MATNKAFYVESSRKSYNNVDFIEQLMYVEAGNNEFAGYRRQLLVHSLSEIEIDFYVCTECKGVMRNACQIGKEQHLVCEGCVQKGVPSLSMVKSRNKILELQAKCPLVTRGCNWNGKMAEVEEHLIICQRVVVKCEKGCRVILPRRELDNHVTLFCVKRQVMCEHCDVYFMYEQLTEHHGECLEYQVSCPNNCNVSVKRKLIGSHLELECPNMVVECPYKKFGCERKVLRCELEEHKKINQIQHLEYTSLFAISEIEQLKQTNIQLTEANKQLTKANKQQHETNIQLNRRVNILENQVEGLSYHIILRDEVTDGNTYTVNWRSMKMKVKFYCSQFNGLVVHVIVMDVYMKNLLAKWPFEGRFKLTIIDRTNECHIYKSDLVKLQPRDIPRYGEEYPHECTIMRTQYKASYVTYGKLNVILQIQDIENP